VSAAGGAVPHEDWASSRAPSQGGTPDKIGRALLARPVTTNSMSLPASCAGQDERDDACRRTEQHIVARPNTRPDRLLDGRGQSAQIGPMRRRRRVWAMI
jgi:hypothetical protein